MPDARFCMDGRLNNLLSAGLSEAAAGTAHVWHDQLKPGLFFFAEEFNRQDDQAKRCHHNKENKQRHQVHFNDG